MAASFAHAATPLLAGDILRGGAPANVRGTPQAGGGGTAPVQAAKARANARDTLARTSRALQDARAMQQAARAAAQSAARLPNPAVPGALLPAVPNGLAPGGLQLAGSPVGALNPVQKGAGGAAAAQVTVKQTAQQAILTWQSFNVGRDTDLRFDQSAGGANRNQWIAFNKVNDPSGVPSQILGSIQADGQVYVINQNGIIFGGTSQVNAHTLVASALPINDNLIQRGLLNQSSTAQFLFSGLPQSGDTPFTPPPPPPDGKYGNVTVLAGARLTAPTTDANVGGRVALVGANVSNQGTIDTPDGQTILAAGLQVGFAAHSSSDASLRGLDAYVGQVGDYAGTATNAGLIEIPRGSAALTGKEVNQLGVIAGTTAVSLNGRIDLRAEYNAAANQKFDPVFSATSPPFLYGGQGAAQSTGRVTIGPRSVMSVLPEWGSPDRVIGTSLALRSQVNARGKSVQFGPGSLLHAPNGTVTVETGVWDLDAPQNRTAFVRTGGQIYLDRDAAINVAGTTDASASLEQHILTVILRSSELADSPLQRDTFFRGGEITVDLRKSGTYNGREWVGTPLADLRGYLNLIERTVDELTVAGGTVNLASGGSIVVQPGASIDTSAGWVNYGSGTVKTTRLLRFGRLVDIASATPDLLYDGIFTGEFVENHPKWGVTRTYRVPWMTGEHFEQGYLSGAAAGNLSLAAASMALDGTFRASAVSGPRQTTTPARGGTLDLSFEVQKLVPGGPIDPLVSPTPPSVVFREDGGQRPADPFSVDAAGDPAPLRADRVATVVLSPALFDDGGFAALRVRNPDGAITVPRDITLATPVKGAITFEAANVSIAGRLLAPGGALSFLAYNISPSVAETLNQTPGAVLPPPNPDRGNFTLGSGAVLSAAGQIIDYRPSGRTPFDVPVVNDGGTVSIKSFAASLAAGSGIDVSGGVIANTRGGFSYGRAGSIEILTGRDLSIPAVDGGRLRLGATLKGFSGVAGGGGALSLQAQLIQVGGARLHPLAFQVGPDFFNQGGFSRFTLTGIGLPGEEEGTFLPAVNIAAGTVIEPRALGWLAVPYAFPFGDLGLRPYLRPEGLRSPVNLTFQGLGARDTFGNRIVSIGSVVYGAGSIIRTDALGSVAFRGETVSLAGSVYAPGGSITVSGANQFPAIPAGPPLPTVHIAGGVVLSTAGRPVLLTHPNGWRQGQITPGGTITVSGNIVAERGAVLDVSGSTGVLDLPPTYLATANRPWNSLRGVQYVPVRIDSGGGSIRLAGGELLYSDATLVGRPGGPSAIGGSVSVSSGRFRPAGEASTSAEENLIVKQSGAVLPGGVSRGIGRPVLAADGTALPALGQFALSSMTGGGFDALALGGNVRFDGPISITMPGRLQVASGGVIYATDDIRLTAPYVGLGQAFRPPSLAGQEPFIFTQTDAAGLTTQLALAPSYGPGRLIVQADLIDVGNLSLQGIGSARLSARRGDIRGNGTLSMAGDLVLEAGQVYPTTLRPFNLFAHDYTTADGARQGSLTILGGGARDLPLSGGGTLSLYASSINQSGTLRAPIGVINLGWNGSGPAPVDPIAQASRTTPVTSDLTLGAGSLTSVSAVDPRTGRGLLIPYGISLDGISWLDPAGNDITVGGVPAKAVNISAQNVATSAGSVIDVRGGGDLFAYRWVAGSGGSQDILASSTAFAVIPGHGFNYAPYAPFNPAASSLNGEPGYTTGSLRVGDVVTLGSGAGLPAGTYTLLPARYALMPGAFLVTPQSGAPVGSVALADGSSLVSGYRFNSLDATRSGVSLMQRFEVAPSSVYLQRAQYEVYSANSFLREAAVARDFAVPRLPVDSGQLSFNATTSMVLNGLVSSRAPSAGRGALVDLSSPGDIVINAGGTGGGVGVLALSAAQLNSFAAESLLVGGQRTSGTGGLTIAVTTKNLTVDNAGAPLLGSDIILVSREALTLADGAEVRGTGAGPVENLLLGDPAVAGSGDGTLLRASGSTGGSIVRRGVSDSVAPRMTIGAGAVVGGGSLILDSTAGTSLDPLAVLDAAAVTLNSGQITLALDNAGVLAPTTGLVLAGQALASLQANARTLSLLSYSSLDVYGTGVLGSRDALDALTLSAPAIRTFNSGGGTAVLAARSILMDNATGRPAPAAVAGPGLGTLRLEADQITLGAGTVEASGQALVDFRAADRLLATGTGGFRARGNVRLETPLLTAAQAAVHGVVAGGDLVLVRPATSGIGVAGGLGARLTLEGATVRLDSNLALPSGELVARATSGDLRLGTAAAALIDLAGTQRSFLDVSRYTDGGIATLMAEWWLGGARLGWYR
jgi:filamentous hemagglutinin